jgi:hypothetical protein
MTSLPVRRTASIALTLLLAACGGSATTTTDTGTATRAAAIQIISGNVQAGVVGAELSAPLVVRVVDAGGSPISGQVVNFRVVEGGGTTFAGTAITNAASSRPPPAPAPRSR